MKIASKIRLFTLSLVVVASITVSIAIFWGYEQVVLGLQIESLETRAELDASRLKVAFAELTHDIRLLAGMPSLKQVVAATGADQRAAAKSTLASVFRETLQAKPHYVQIRLIAAEDDGIELVRVERRNSAIVRVAEDGLQKKGNRRYFQEAMRNPPGVIYYSQVDLNREFGILETPHRPMLRVALPLYGSTDSPLGIVIINLEWRSFLEEHLLQQVVRHERYLANEAGYFLLHPDASRAFGFEFGIDSRAEVEFPALAGFFDSPAPEKTFHVKTAASNRILHFRKLEIFESGEGLILGLSANRRDIVRASTSIGRDVLLLVLLLVLGGSVAAVWLASKLTRPLEDIAFAARRLAAGKQNADLPLDRKDEIGELAHSFQSMRTAVKTQEANLLRANDALSEANRDLEHFAHIASHELREPLRRMAGLANLLKIESGPDAADLSEKLEDEATRALRQIADFRAFATIDPGIRPREEVDLSNIVSTVLDSFAEQIDLRGVSTRIDPLPRLRGYETLIHVLYRNLVENAFRHSRPGAFELAFTAERHGEEWVLGVFNSGSAIEERYRVAVFALFTRLETTQPGSGVGLSICKRIVDRHSGIIWLDSDVSERTVHVKFTLEQWNGDRDREV